jgi:hypothetical protein
MDNSCCKAYLIPLALQAAFFSPHKKSAMAVRRGGLRRLAKRDVWPVRGLQVCTCPALDGIRCHGPGLPRYFAALLEEYQGGNAANAKSRRQILLRFGVDFA